MVIFHSYVNVYQRVASILISKCPATVSPVFFDEGSIVSMNHKLTMLKKMIIDIQIIERLQLFLAVKDINMVNEGWGLHDFIINFLI